MNEPAPDGEGVAGGPAMNESALTSQRCPSLSYLADQVAELPLTYEKHAMCGGNPGIGTGLACRCAFSIAIASSSEYMGPAVVGVVAGVAVHANAISTIRASDIEDR